MKKTSYLILGIVLFLSVSLNVHALSEQNVVCEYENITETGKKNNIAIYYNSKSQTFYALSYGDTKIYYFHNNNVHTASGVLDNLNNLKCPKNAYKDDNFVNELCFDNDGVHCLTTISDKKDGITSRKYFSGKVTKTKDMGDIISDELKKYLFYVDIDDTYDLTALNAEDYKEKITKEMDDYLLENNNDLKNLKYPENMLKIIKNSEPYQKKLQTSMEDFKIYIETYVRTESQRIGKDENLSTEQKENLIQGLESRKATILKDLDGYISDIKSGKIDKEKTPIADSSSCTGLLGANKKGEPLYYLNFAFNLLKYIGLVMFLVLTVMDFVKAIANNNDDGIKKAINKAIKRLIIVVILFLLPVLINFLLNIFGLTSGTCGIGSNG